MEIKLPEPLTIAGIILSLVGMYLLAGINLEFSLTSLRIQWLPLVGTIILGIGLAILYHKRDMLATIITFIGFLAMGIINVLTIGFAFGMLIPGLIGKARSLPNYTAALVIFAVVMVTISNNPIPYQNKLIDQITELAASNVEGMSLGLENQVERFLPNHDQVNQIVAAMVSCENSTYKEQCLALRQQLADQMYMQIHSPETINRIKDEIRSSFKVDKTTIKAMVTSMPMMSMVLDNVAIIYAFMEAGIFLVYTIPLGISLGITEFVLSVFLSKKEESEEKTENEPGGI